MYCFAFSSVAFIFRSIFVFMSCDNLVSIRVSVCSNLRRIKRHSNYSGFLSSFHFKMCYLLFFIFVLSFFYRWSNYLCLNYTLYTVCSNKQSIYLQSLATNFKLPKSLLGPTIGLLLLIKRLRVLFGVGRFYSAVY